MKWPDHRLVANSVFWPSLIGAILSLAWYLWVNWHWIITTIDSSMHRQAIGLVVIFLSVLIGVFGLWLIAAPVSKEKQASASATFTLGNAIYYESRAIKTPDGRDTRLYETTFYLIVSNTTSDGSTLRNIQAEIVGYDTPVVAGIRGSPLDRIDLKHGQAAFFLIGKTVGTHYLGNFVGDVVYVPDKMRRYVQNIASGRRPTFEVWSFDNVYRYGLNQEMEKSNWPLRAVISADDRKSKTVDLEVKSSSQIPVSYASEGEQ